MTLKQALISESFYREPEAPNVIYINLSQIPNVEKLIKEVYINGLADGHDRKGTFVQLWQEKKERWLGK